jgi:uncharacterized protein (TIGR00730 family)
MHFLSRISVIIKTFFNTIHSTFQLIHGIWKISKTKGPIVSIFGGAQLPANNMYAQQAQLLAQKIVTLHINIMTGGGTGIMQAANCGALKNEQTMSIGIGIKGFEDKNACMKQYIEVDQLYIRKWLLMRYSMAFVIFPGGYGTLDELAELLTLMKIKKLHPAPIVLIGTKYWQGLIYWLHTEGLTHGAVTQEHLDLFTITDDLNKALCLIEDTCKKKTKRNPQEGSL